MKINKEDIDSDMPLDSERLLQRMAEVKIIANMCFGMNGSDTQVAQVPWGVEQACYTLQEIIDSAHSDFIREAREQIVNSELPIEKIDEILELPFLSPKEEKKKI